MRVEAAKRGRRGKCVCCGAVVPIDASTIREGDGEPTGVRSFESDGAPGVTPHEPPPAPVTPAAPAAPGQAPHNPWGEDADALVHAGRVQPSTPWTEGRSAIPVARRDCCGRCGRSFRGEWDRHARGDEIVCNICANLAQHMAAPVPAPRLPQPAVAPPTREELRAFRSLDDRPPTPDPNRYRGLKPFLIVFGVTMLAILVFPVDVWVAWLSERRFENRPAELPPIWNRVLWALVLLLIFFKQWLAVYLGILWVHREGRSTFIVEALEAAKYAIILSGIAFMAAIFAAGMPGLGLLLGLLAVCLPPLVLWAFTDLEGYTVLVIIVFCAIVEPFMPLLTGILFGIVGLLAT